MAFPIPLLAPVTCSASKNNIVIQPYAYLLYDDLHTTATRVPGLTTFSAGAVNDFVKRKKSKTIDSQ
jgi:hypothetical protein